MPFGSNLTDFYLKKYYTIRIIGELVEMIQGKKYKMNSPQEEFLPSQSTSTRVEVEHALELVALKARVTELERLLNQNGSLKNEPSNLPVILPQSSDKVLNQKSEEQARFILEAAGISTWEWNITRNEVKWSDNTAALLGLPQKAFRGSGDAILEFIHPLDKPVLAEAIDNALREKGYFEVEMRVLREDGSIRWFICKGKVLCQGPGQNTLVLGVNYDIHHLKHVTESLRFLVEANHTLTASLDYQQTLKDLAALAVPNLADWCMVFIQENQDEIKQLAVIHSDPVKVEWALQFQKNYFVDKDTREKLQKDIIQVMRTGKPQFLPEMTDETLEEIAIDNKHLQFMQEMGPRSKMALPLISRNRTLGVISFIVTSESGRNYTSDDLKLAQQLANLAGQAIDNAWLYRQAQEAIQTQLELDHHKDNFLSIASHELRTPLTTIKGYSQILHRNLTRQEASKAPGDSAINRELRILDNIVNQVGRMDSLISEMLDISRIQSGQFELKRTYNVDINALIRRVVEQQQDSANGHPITLQTNNAKCPGFWDEGRLEQVLNNLISNALKYSSAGMPVEVGVKISPVQNEVIVWVRDEGIGISPEHQRHIFDRFYRARTPMNVNVDGLGLGLFISYETVTQHRGRMWLESVPGRGSTFFFALPLGGGTEVAF